MSENHPAWKSYFDHQSQFSYPKKGYWDERKQTKPYDQDAEDVSALLKATENYSHDLGMVKDILIVMMNLLEKQGNSIGELYELLEENTDMIDLLIAGTDDGD
jgi:hypothetical protein